MRPVMVPDEFPVQQVNKPVILLTGLCVGLLTGFVGAGGGFIIVPALIFCTGMPVKHAIGTSLFIITINAATGFVCDFTNGTTYNWNFLLVFMTVTVTGMLLSTFFMTQVKTALLKKLFAWTMLLTGCWIIIKELLLNKMA